jgi:ribosome-associated protein
MIETVTSETNTRSTEHTSQQLAFLAADAADDRKAGDMLLIDISQVSVLADYLLIVSGFSKVQLRAISNSIIDKIEEEYDRPPLRIEGQNQGGWILLDYGDTIVHIMMPEQREFYNLEAFWGHGETVPLPDLGNKDRGSKYNTDRVLMGEIPDDENYDEENDENEASDE